MSEWVCIPWLRNARWIGRASEIACKHQRIHEVTPLLFDSLIKNSLYMSVCGGIAMIGQISTFWIAIILLIMADCLPYITIFYTCQQPAIIRNYYVSAGCGIQFIISGSRVLMPLKLALVKLAEEILRELLHCMIVIKCNIKLSKVKT